jgi:hypothetical protein
LITKNVTEEKAGFIVQGPLEMLFKLCGKKNKLFEFRAFVL